MFSKEPHGCPRGFKWCDKKQECIPDGIVPADRLEQKYQRFFFKEGVTMEDIDKLVDEVFAGGFDHFGRVRKAEKKIDRLLDNVKTTGRPYDHPIKMKVTPTLDGKTEVDVDECAGPLINSASEFEGSDVDGGEQPAKEENPQKQSNDINHVPNQNVQGLKKSIHDELGEAVILKVVENAKSNPAYKSFVTKALIEFEYTAEMPMTKKLILFNALDEAWRMVHEQEDEEEDIVDEKCDVDKKK